MHFSYKTIESPSKGFYSEKKSKFYSFAYPIEKEAEIKKILKKLKKEHHGARHYVYAFCIDIENQKFRYSDDGEPSNSSGLPVFKVIKSNELTNILIVVVRYFGGKKLGIPGLINAYRTAAEEAIKNARIIEKKVFRSISLEFDYSQLNYVISLIEKYRGKIKNQTYSQICKMEVDIPLENLSTLKNHIKEQYRIKINEADQ